MRENSRDLQSSGARKQNLEEDATNVGNKLVTAIRTKHISEVNERSEGPQTRVHSNFNLWKKALSNIIDAVASEARKIDYYRCLSIVGNQTQSSQQLP